MSVGVWALASLPGGDLENSYLARFGQLLEPIGRWMGMDWRLTVALLTSFPAKENAIATLGVLYGRVVPNAGDEASLAQTLAATYSPAVALAFLTVTMLFIPCTATVAAIRQETGSWKWTGLNLGLMLSFSIAAGAVVYALARAWGG